MRGLAGMPQAPPSPSSPGSAGDACEHDRAADAVVRDWRSALPESVTVLAWTDGGGLCSGAADGSIRLHGIGGVALRVLAAHDGGVTALCPRPGTDAVASAGEDGRVCLWGSDGDVPEIPMQSSHWVEHLAWTGDGRTLAAAAGRSLQLWRDAGSAGIWYDSRRTVLAFAWAPDGRRLAIAANQGLHVWRDGAEAPAQLLDFPGAPLAVDWRSDGKALAVGTQDGFLQVWRQPAPAGKRGAGGQLTMRGYPAKVRCVHWHPRRSRVATAGGSDVAVWDTPQTGPGRAVPLRAHEAAVTALAYAPDGGLLASADRDGRVCLWRDGGDLLLTFVLGAEVTALSWSPDGAVLALGCTDGQLRVLEPGGRRAATAETKS
ncbi:MAG: hypothetical protein K9L70_01635 [Thiohalocapsa sp.]|nr:hypothetical protein [Thiohalocapsa sp.]